MRALLVGVSGPAVAVAAWRAARRSEVRARFASTDARRRLPEPMRMRLAAALTDAGLVVEPEDAVIAWGAATGAVMLLTLGLGAGGAGVGAVAAAGVLGPVGALRAGRARRRRALTASLPALLDRVVAELRAGETLAGAVSRTAASDVPLAADLRWVEAEVRMGLPLADALGGWPARRPEVAGVAVVAGALAMCATVGGRAAGALEGLAAAARDRLAVAAEAGALSAQARASAVLVGGAPVAVLAWSAFTGGGALRALVATPTGWVCAALGGALEVVGAWWMVRIIRAGSGG